ncbi:MAG: hypothetical protein AAFU41_03260 [Pseudomonadota bacterium]
MTISLPGSKKRSGGLFARKKKPDLFEPTAKNKLDGDQIARLFDKRSRPTKTKPASLNDTEEAAQLQQSSLRGALYSKD